MSEIAAMHGVTKNTVVGAVYRYRKNNNLPGRAEAANDVPFPTSRIEALTCGRCLWMGGSIASDEFCNQIKKSGSPYCEDHHKRVWSTYTQGERHER